MASSQHKGGRRHVDIAYEGDGQGKSAATSANQHQTRADNGILPSKALPSLAKPDNAALALHTIAKGSELVVDGRLLESRASFDVPEGHRFATQDIKAGDIITSWGIPFGIALRDIEAGEYLCNVKSLANLKERGSKLQLPEEPNFKNQPFQRYLLDKSSFAPSKSTQELNSDLMPSCEQTFLGFARAGGRGVGTRNFVVIIGTNVHASSLVKAAEKACLDLKRSAKVDGPGIGLWDGCDGVVAVAHTEGHSSRSDMAEFDTGRDVPNNWRKLVRTLAGYVIHPNVGAAILVDRGSEGNSAVTAEDILSYARSQSYPLEACRIETYRATGEFAQDLDNLVTAARALHEQASQDCRTECPQNSLIVAQQCGGSDAFSGISANPLAGWVARQLILHGGSALLAETDELIGAEEYVLARLRDYDTGDKFLRLVDRYYRYAQRFGHSPEGNPSGGNLYRGLYNITLKSAGAAMKKLPSVRLENVIEYGELLTAKPHGYSFMDSPGNDLESIAGQVASGSNVIMFTTGNGSITNFPFVPTIKVLTTSKRYELLSNDMDINAGTFLEGESLDSLGQHTFDYMLGVCSGKRSKGELAGHHQVQIWRNWTSVEGDEHDVAEDLSRQQDTIMTESSVETQGQHVFDAENRRQRKAAVTHSDIAEEDDQELDTIHSSLRLLQLDTSSAWRPEYADVSHAGSSIGLVLPTSLCSGQVSRIFAERLNTLIQENPSAWSVSRVVALPHTEGCGHSAGGHENLVVRTLIGYAAHPTSAFTVLLEHGCEKTHTGRLRSELEARGYDPDRFGYVSIQLDGGIEKAYEKVKALFEERCRLQTPHQQVVAPGSQLRVGMVSSVKVPLLVLKAMSRVAASIIRHGGTVVAAGTIRTGAFLEALFLDAADLSQDAFLPYGEQPQGAGLHVMASPTISFVELLTGLGATGVDVILAFISGPQAEMNHPLLPVIQVGLETSSKKLLGDVDVHLCMDADLGADEEAVSAVWARELLGVCVDTVSGRRQPNLSHPSAAEFQISRETGAVSM